MRWAILLLMLSCSPADTHAYCEKYPSVPECFIGTQEWFKFCADNPKENLLCRGYWPKELGTPLENNARHI